MFNIYGFHLVVTTTANTQFVVTNEYVEEPPAGVLDRTNFIFAADLTIDGQPISLTLPKPIKTKYLSLGPVGAVSTNIMLVIYYELEQASKVDLIWEFVKRGKNP